MEIFNDLAVMPDLVAKLVKQFPREKRNWKPASWEGVPGEKFSVLGHVCHLRDIEVQGYQSRFLRAIKERSPELLSLDGYDLEITNKYDQADLEEVLGSFQEARTVTLKLISGLADSDLKRTAIFAGYGVVNVQAMIHLLRSHDLQHLACLEWLFAKAETDEQRI
jgi:hypothetical protein